MRAENAEANVGQQTEELNAVRKRNEALTAEAASLSEQLALLSRSEEDLQLDRTRTMEEISDLRERLNAAERKEEQAAGELAGLRSLLGDMSAEHERLQQRLAEGLEEIERLQQQQHQPMLQPPPPDVTAGGPAVAAGSQQQQQPDVAALRGQHGNPPDLMPGKFTIKLRIPLGKLWYLVLWENFSILFSFAY